MYSICYIIRYRKIKRLSFEAYAIRRKGMGKLMITGKAEREVCYDVVELTVTFYNDDRNSSDAIDTVIKQSEKFLSIIASKGADISKIRMDDDSLERSSRYDDKRRSSARRSFTLRTAFDMKFINSISQIIRNENFNAEIKYDYLLTNKEEIHKELLKEALEDSRKKAEMIAETVGEKITGIDEMKLDNIKAYIRQHMEERELSFVDYYESESSYSDELSSPVTTETETVNVTWIIE